VVRASRRASVSHVLAVKMPRRLIAVQEQHATASQLILAAISILFADPNNQIVVCLIHHSIWGFTFRMMEHEL